MQKKFNYMEERVFVVKFTTNYGTFEFDLDFVENIQEQTLKLLNQFRQ